MGVIITFKMGFVITSITMLIMQYGTNTISTNGFWSFVISAIMLTLASMISMSLFLENGITGILVWLLTNYVFQEHIFSWMTDVVGIQTTGYSQLLKILLPSVIIYIITIFVGVYAQVHENS